MKSLPCISMWRPWSQWVAQNFKTCETRTHTRFAKLKGKRIGIHAALKYDKTALAQAFPFMNDAQRLATASEEDCPTGIICTALVYEFRPLLPSDSAYGLIECASVQRYGLFLRDIFELNPIPAKGKQGIFYVEVEDYIADPYGKYVL